MLARCRELGFANAGISTVEPSRWGEALRQWIAEGRHGTMAYLGDHLDTRLDPAKFLPGAKSAILVADLYAARPRVSDGGGARDGDATSAAVDAGGGPSRPRGRIARYARGRDYHRMLTRRLHALSDDLRGQFPDASFRTFVDIHPVLERELAQRAGLGWVGKHTLIIHPRLGSYFFLGGVMTTLDLAPPTEQRAVADHCGTCTRCIDACPTKCITPYSVDASRCIAYLTIEHREPIDESLRAPMGPWLFGCDICQEVCPHNSPRAASALSAREPHAAYAPRRDGFDLLEVLNWTEADRLPAFSGTPLGRASLEKFQRNAAIAAGNALAEREDEALRARLKNIAADERVSPIVRDAAAWAAGRRP